MILATRLAVILALAVPGAAAAQSSLPAHVGDNANIVPIYQGSDPPAADDYLRGNLLGQRCNEASIDREVDGAQGVSEWPYLAEERSF